MMDYRDDDEDADLLAEARRVDEYSIKGLYVCWVRADRSVCDPGHVADVDGGAVLLDLYPDGVDSSSRGSRVVPRDEFGKRDGGSLHYGAGWQLYKNIEAWKEAINDR